MREREKKKSYGYVLDIGFFYIDNLHCLAAFTLKDV